MDRFIDHSRVPVEKSTMSIFAAVGWARTVVATSLVASVYVVTSCLPAASNYPVNIREVIRVRKLTGRSLKNNSGDQRRLHNTVGR